MASYGKMWRSRRNIWALSVVIFLQLLASVCLSASITVHTQDQRGINQSQTLNSTSVNKEAGNTEPFSPEKTPALPDPKNTVKPADGKSTATKPEALKGNVTNAAKPETSIENEEKHPDIIIDADHQKEPVGNGDTKPVAADPGEDTTDEVTTSQTMSTPPTYTASVKTSEMVKTVTLRKEALGSDPKDSIPLDMSTVQYTYSDMLQTSDREQAPPLDLGNYKDDNDAYGDEDDMDGYESNDGGKEQTGTRLEQPDEMEKTHYEEVNIYNSEEEDSHFFFHLVILAFLVAIFYITYHNKRRILLLAQSRRWKDALCSRNMVEYRRLDQNVDEAMPSLKMTKEYIF